MNRQPRWLQDLLPPPVHVGQAERLRAWVGAAVGILFTGLLSRWLGGGQAGPWLVAPLGASAVLVFAVPVSPLAQPWSVVGIITQSDLVRALYRAVQTPQR